MVQMLAAISFGSQRPPEAVRWNEGLGVYFATNHPMTTTIIETAASASWNSTACFRTNPSLGDANDCGRQQALIGKPKEEKGENGSRPTNKDNNGVFGQKGVHSLDAAAR
jgi:hypothetical protein